ncbi:MAG TPA: hypothetical protein LFV91_06865 [Rickettsia endosymbiont of Bembidion nr. Transversale]|nr:hypothetical protein [Rickettsia endosymbiont of Bembidion nr. Transversale]
MKLSYINGFGNKGNTFVAQGILKSSLPYQANLNATPQYLLTPDYFLPAIHSGSYYSRKYSDSTNFSKHKSLRTRFKQVATVSLIFLSMVTGEVFAGDKRPKSKAMICQHFSGQLFMHIFVFLHM